MWFSLVDIWGISLFLLTINHLEGFSLRHGLGPFSHSLEHPVVNSTDIFYLMKPNKSMNTFQNYEKNNQKAERL